MKKVAMAVVAALAAACVLAQDAPATRGPRRQHGERNGERRAHFDRMPPPMMMHGSGAMVLRMLSSKAALERIGVTDEAQSQKIIDAIKPLREECDKLEDKIRELSREQLQSLRELLKDKAADPKAAMDKVGELEKLRAEQGRLSVKAVLVLRDNLTPEQAEKAGEMISGRGRGMRPGGMGPGGERRRPRPNDGERRRTPPPAAEKPAADK